MRRRTDGASARDAVVFVAGVGLADAADDLWDAVSDAVSDAVKGNNINAVYGAATTGIDWQFLKLQEKQLHLDMATYTIERCDRILGILASMVEQKA